jgi:translation initiation factor IF-1
VSKADFITAEGVVRACHKGAKFTIELDGTNHEVLGHLAGRLRRHMIRILPGDRVQCELSPYSMDLARITYRYLDR